VTVQRATPADALALAALEALAAHAPWRADALAQTLALDTTLAWWIPHAGYAVGSAAAGEGELILLGVAPEARRRGLATALLAALDADWRSRQVESAFLEVRADNVTAQALYTHLGWHAAGRRKGYYQDGTDALLMRRTLLEVG
jgi:ribosomal-protein-alanine N-acetyltransferase